MGSGVFASHLIFTRLEAPFSPKGRSGYQTAFHSSSISQDEVRNIEKRVQSFQPSGPKIRRYQFFLLGDSRFVVTRSQIIHSHPEFIDSSQRPGVFLAHCLVFDQKDFAEFEYNPFNVLDGSFSVLKGVDGFIADPEPVGQLKSITDRVEIEPSRHKQDLNNPQAAELRQLAIDLANETRRAEKLVAGGRSIWLVGEDREVVDTLKLTFHEVPDNLRRSCTFDTHVDNCSVRAGDYWAVGSSRVKSGNSFVLADVGQRTILTGGSAPKVGTTSVAKGENDLSDNSAYFNWLNTAGSKLEFKQLLHDTMTAKSIDRAMRERTRLDKKIYREVAVTTYFEANREELLGHFRRIVSDQTTEETAQSFSDYLAKSGVFYLLDTAASGKILTRVVAFWLVNRNPKLSKKSWKVLRSFAEESRDYCLMHLTATFPAKPDVKLRNAALKAIEPKEFTDISLAALMNPVEPKQFVGSNGLLIGALLKHERIAKISDEHLLGLVRSILKFNHGQYLHLLADQVASAGPKCVREIHRAMERRIRKRAEVADAFVTAVRSAVGERRRWFAIPFRRKAY